MMEYYLNWTCQLRQSDSTCRLSHRHQGKNILFFTARKAHAAHSRLMFHTFGPGPGTPNRCFVATHESWLQLGLAPSKATGHRARLAALGEAHASPRAAATVTWSMRRGERRRGRQRLRGVLYGVGGS